jgi:hypothetical protein
MVELHALVSEESDTFISPAVLFFSSRIPDAAEWQP